MVTVSTEDKDSLHPVKEGDERSDHTPSIWDPPGNLWVKEYQYPPFTMEVMIARLFQQIWDLLSALRSATGSQFLGMMRLMLKLNDSTIS